jgi:ABC-type branched-subunit amino acid transport system substrate-binding protein
MAFPLPQIAWLPEPTAGKTEGLMLEAVQAKEPTFSRLGRNLRGLLALASFALMGCSGSSNLGLGSLDIFNESQPPPRPVETQAPTTIGTGTIRVGLILPLSAGGNAGVAAQSMRNAAELALAEFANPNIQLIVKDDGGTAQGAQAAVLAAIQEGAEIVLGPLFSPSVAVAGQTARNRGIPMIAFSTDANVAARGVYLLSFLPESDVERILGFAVSRGKKSVLALLPENAYGTVVEAQLQQVVAASGARLVAIERYAADQGRVGESVKRIANAARQADILFFAEAADATPQIIQTLSANGVKPGRLQFIGTGLWDDNKLFANPGLAGAWFAAPDVNGYRAFAQRYKARFGQDPVRTASLSYDAVSLVASLVKTQGANRFSETVLTNPSGFSGIDGVFRFRADGTCERGLAVMEMRNGSVRVISPAPRAFNAAAL